MSIQKRASFYAFLAASLYALNMPLSKTLLTVVGPFMMASLLYLGAGMGMTALVYGPRLSKKESFSRFTREEIPFVILMIVLDITAPALLMFGLRSSSAATSSLLGNFEIVATSLIALLLFHEQISARLWTGIGMVTIASLILSIDPQASFHLSPSALLVIGATICWGLENNCTRQLSNRSSSQIVMIKGLGSGFGSLILAIYLKEKLPVWYLTAAVLLLGFIAYGLSIYFYILAQRHLGAAKTSAYYAAAPFLGVLFSALLFMTLPDWLFWIGLLVMLGASYFLISDSIGVQHTHVHEHRFTAQHQHGELIHEHELVLVHSHLHAHQAGVPENHQHPHKIIPFHEHATM